MDKEALAHLIVQLKTKNIPTQERYVSALQHKISENASKCQDVLRDIEASGEDVPEHLRFEHARLDSRNADLTSSLAEQEKHLMYLRNHLMNLQSI